MRAQEAVTLTETVPGPVELKGGRYGVLCQATFGGGSVKLQVQLPDGTFVSVVAATDFTANSTAMVTVDLPPGQYKAVVTTATGVKLVIARVPLES